MAAKLARFGAALWFSLSGTLGVAHEAQWADRIVNRQDVILRFKPGLSGSERRDLLNDLGLKEVRAYRSGMLFLKSRFNMSPQQFHAYLNWLNRDVRVEYAEPNYWYQLDELIPNDPLFSKQYGLHQPSGYSCRLPQLWPTQTGSAQVRVGVIDSGIDITHPDLAANIWQNPGEVGIDANGNDKARNGIDDDSNGYVDDVMGWNFVDNSNSPLDDTGHGTHVAGIIGAVGDNTIGISGVAWSVRLAALKVFDALGRAKTEHLLEAIEYANAMHFDLTNNSWGGGNFSQAILDAIHRGGEKDILFVAAAGNGQMNNDIMPHYPASYEDDAVIAVAATNRTGTLASFSNYGQRRVHVAAPGQDIISTYPQNQYQNLSGTSMATPHVAGLLALLKAQFPNLRSQDLRSRLFFSSEIDRQLAVKYGRVSGASLFENDVSAPGLIRNLRITSPEIDGLQMSWQHAGDDGDQGEAQWYEVRLARNPIFSEEDWQHAQLADAQQAYDTDSGVVKARIKGLPLRSSGYVSVRAIDNVGNRGPIAPSLPFKTLELKTIYENDAGSLANVTVSGSWGIEAKDQRLVWSDSPNGLYENASDTSLTLPVFTFHRSQLYVELIDRYELEANFDFAILEISFDNGQTWTEVNRASGKTEFGVRVFAVPVPEQSDQAQIRLRVLADRSMNYDGWYIDHIKVME